MTDGFTGYTGGGVTRAADEETPQSRRGGSWFDEAAFGLFIHWDHASQQGLEVSWPMVDGVNNPRWRQVVGVDEYRSSAATFDPVEWNAPALARAAREAGMRYAVLTTRHHSGYSMFHTAGSTHSVEHSPYGKDIVREFADAMRAEGLRVGFYYSLSDWTHPDYPAMTDDIKPYAVAKLPKPTPEQWERYITYMRLQLTELLTNYGRIDMLWFDGHWERDLDDWYPDELKTLIHSLQPDILVNDRLPGLGDFETPEQFVPDKPLEARWETCMTMNQNWGYVPDDENYKSVREILQTLVNVVSRRGNLLLNVSPTGSGALPASQQQRLEAFAEWMSVHSESVHGVEPGLEPWQFGGPSTRRGDRIYLHMLAWPLEHLAVRGLPVRRIEKVTLLSTGEDLPFTVPFGVAAMKDADPHGEIRIGTPAAAPDTAVPVIAIDLAPLSAEI
ncbi:alpha-L-fucosidase [Microbacterium sp.]|uniref:alpha-L-fucosidase n=1 Tax=Microbacterium sp. TaxID=51671 RepID=UPI0028ACE263|nr:alpha-L-fucosidase [Microbacterium sp.]